MKRLYLILLLTVLMLAGCATQNQDVTQPSTPAPLELLETAWNAIPEESRFPAYGGNATEEIQEGPGVLDMTNTDLLTYTMLIPENQTKNISQAAALIHLMNGNALTCGVYQLKDISATEFTDALRENIQNNQWLCGAPDRLVIASFGEDTVLAVFGWDDVMAIFLDAMDQNYSDQMTVTVDEAIS